LKDISIMTGAEVRRRFLDYFAKKGHTEVPSSPLVPEGDATLLFVNAGMVQFKDVFTGQSSRPYKRAVSSQKCLRVSGKHNDLETVGRTARHHTFFEMLGNFSFGDYFKKEAIEYAWEFLTVDMGIPAEKLHATVFTDDDEAAKIWEETIGLPADRLSRLGEKDNFWSMGDTGPCGPCSEIHYDRGEEHKCDNPDCGVDCECDRYLELWNLVFMQYDRDESGKMTPLPNPSIDTGMGLERLVSVIQGKGTNFETDLILPVIRHMERIADPEYGADPVTDVSFRVIGDHVRATTFLIADGVFPSNEGKGYVLRRIIRRALRHGKMLGVAEPFAHRLVDTVVEMMKDSYPELLVSEKVIRGVVLSEEEGFSATLEHGMNLIAGIIKANKDKGEMVISGAEAFQLYDTYGFPMDLANDIVEDAGMSIDMAEYSKQMKIQRENARKSWKGASTEAIDPVYKKMAEKVSASAFTGFQSDTTESTVLGIIKNGEETSSANGGEEVELVLDKTPFYAESGGQVSDTGTISGDSFVATVSHVSKPDGAHWFHKVKVETGTIKTGDKISASINKDRRDNIRRNHSATHLLQAALRIAIGGHVKQAGSLVDSDRLRFDYAHFTAPSAKDIERIESLVNGQILKNLTIATEEKGFDEAVKEGATALFGEKYGDSVRVVSMGDFSTELCGGTHATATGDIGLFKIVSEGGVAAGVRRIEAVTGYGALDFINKQGGELKTISDLLRSPVAELSDKVRKQIDRVKELEKENRKLKEKLMSGQSTADDGLALEETISGAIVRVRELEDADGESLRTFVDNNKNQIGSGVIVAGSRQGDKALIAVGVTKDLTKKIQAGKIIKEVASIVGGGGGGRPDFAQAGGKNPEKLEEALKAVPSIIEKLLS
jgi:alanyl-tRNA synthetase